VRISGASGRVERSVKVVNTVNVGTRLAVIAALLGQLAALAHGALVAHVTCGADGELVHVRAEPSTTAPVRDGARAAVDGEGDAHDHCLLDEDGDALCPATHVGAGEPLAPSRGRRSVTRRVRVASAPAPLYRLAPKNSPPA
jgi:hypothetical protein